MVGSVIVTALAISANDRLSLDNYDAMYRATPAMV